MGSGNVRLDKLLEQKQTIENRIKEIQLVESKQRRKFETRRKILLGTMLHKMVVEGRIPHRMFDEFLKGLSDRDRAVFDGYLDEFSTWKPTPTP